MKIYTCVYCNFNTIHNSNYDRHLQTNKHIQMVKSQIEIKKISDFSCKYCGQTYKHKSSIYKHIKYNCTQNKDEDLKELVRLLNLQLDQKEQ